MSSPQAAFFKWLSHFAFGKTRSRKEIADRQFSEKVAAAARSFWFAVEELGKSTSLETREILKSLSVDSAKEKALYRGAKLWLEQCLPRLKTLYERLQKLAVEYPEQFSNARQRSTWAYSTAFRALQELSKFSAGDSSIFHTWLSRAVKEERVTPNPPYPEKVELTYPDWFTSRGLDYKMPSAFAAMFRTMEDELKELNRNSLFDERQQETKTALAPTEKLSSPAIDSAPPVTNLPPVNNAAIEAESTVEVAQPVVLAEDLGPTPGNVLIDRDVLLALIGQKALKAPPGESGGGVTLPANSSARDEDPKKKPAKGRPLNQTVQKRRKVIRGHAHLIGKAYCEALHKVGLPTPLAWQQEDPPCPKDYLDAWKHPKWRQRISDEKYQATHAKKHSS